MDSDCLQKLNKQLRILKWLEDSDEWLTLPAYISEIRILYLDINTTREMRMDIFKSCGLISVQCF